MVAMATIVSMATGVMLDKATVRPMHPGTGQESSPEGDCKRAGVRLTTSHQEGPVVGNTLQQFFGIAAVHPLMIPSAVNSHNMSNFSTFLSLYYFHSHIYHILIVRHQKQLSFNLNKCTMLIFPSVVFTSLAITNTPTDHGFNPESPI